MSVLLARSLQHVHGHIGWLAALALALPAVLLRRPERRVFGAALASTALVTVAAMMGALIYPSYRTVVKPGIFSASPAIGLLFERKEHLGIAALALAWCGLSMYLLAHRREAPRADLGRAAFVSYAGAAIAATLAASGGLIVACYRSF